MKNTVLVLTNSEDGEHTDSVIEHLRKTGQPTFRLNVDKLARGQAKVAVTCENGGFGFEFWEEDNRVYSSEVGAVWYRRPFTVSSPINDPVQREHAKKELDNLLEGLWRTLPEVFWLSSPQSLENARRKMYQLKLAGELGFSVPRTLVTNDPEQARRFVASCSNGAIYKTIHRSYIEGGKEGYAVPTTVVTPALVERMDLIRNLPSLFQERVPKAYELRVTIVGRKIFAVRLNSQKYAGTSVDWRDPDLIAKLDYLAVDLPEEISGQMLRMMEQFGLTFGAFDLAVDPNGKYWFFEVNGNGQWYWLEYETGLLISKAIADILISNANSGV